MLVAVLDTGSFAAAARRLGASSSQASKLVSRLEAELGVQLLKRTTRALAPTEAGQAYYERMKGLLEEFDALDAAVRNASGMPAGRLRLTAPLSFRTLQLAPVLLDFARAYPEIELDVGFSDRTVNLVDEGFDLAVRIGRPGDSSLIARKLCDARVVVVAAPDYLARRGTPTEPAGLADHDCIIDTNFADPLVWRFEGSAPSVPVRGRLRFSNAEASRRSRRASASPGCRASSPAPRSARAGSPACWPGARARRGRSTPYPRGQDPAFAAGRGGGQR